MGEIVRDLILTRARVCVLLVVYNTSIAIGVGVGAAGFAVVIVLLFVIWAKACSNVGQHAKLGDIAASAL